MKIKFRHFSTTNSDFKNFAVCAILNTFFTYFWKGNSMSMTLTTKQRQFLKGLAHHLSPVVMLGGNGLTEGVLAEIENALNHHELIKVKIAGADRETKQLIIQAIVRETKATEVQTIGHILVLYRQSEEKKISLPKATKTV
ncbi:RNA-binding protein [Bibersteinia trehalosi USDA-ARS-USMARC-189]|nr:RNA-binding protein [Bibersteinia trehalosi USDA-ARS-USMARC-189]